MKIVDIVLETVEITTEHSDEKRIVDLNDDEKLSSLTSIIEASGSSMKELFAALANDEVYTNPVWKFHVKKVSK